jgi:hypothetical protein
VPHANPPIINVGVATRGSTGRISISRMAAQHSTSTGIRLCVAARRPPSTGRDAAGALARGFIDAGMSPDTPAMIACNVTRVDEQRLTTRLDLLGLATSALTKDAPTLILVGAAVLLTTPARVAREPALTRSVASGGRHGCCWRCR